MDLVTPQWIGQTRVDGYFIRVSGQAFWWFDLQNKVVPYGTAMYVDPACAGEALVGSTRFATMGADRKFYRGVGESAGVDFGKNYYEYKPSTGCVPIGDFTMGGNMSYYHSMPVEEPVTEPGPVTFEAQ